VSTSSRDTSESPRRLDALTDSHTWADERFFWLCPVVADPNGLTRDKIQAVVISGDAERPAQLAGSIRQLASGQSPTRLHHIEAADWLDRPDEYGLPTANRARDDVGALMDPLATANRVAGMRCATYCRISRDLHGEGAGVERQRIDTEAIAEAEGWEVVHRIVDNDRSASRHARRGREGWEYLMECIEDGSIDAVVAYNVDRLTRQPKELERLIDAADRGVVVRTATGELDLSHAGGRMAARILCSVAAHEAERTSERQTRKLLADAEAGKPHWGHRPYGYNRDGTPNRPEAEVVRKVYARVADGQSSTSVAKWMNSAGHRSTRGGNWRSTTVTSLVKAARNIAQREYHGEIVGPASWPSIVDYELFNRANTAIDARPPVRSGGGRVALLTGLIRCHCGAIMVRGTSNGSPQYRCASRQYNPDSDCSSSASGNGVDELVTGYVLAAAGDVKSATTSAVSGTLEADIGAINSDLGELATMLGERVISMAEYRKARAPLGKTLAAAEAELASRDSSSAISGTIGDPSTLAERWDDLDVTLRRRIIGQVVEQVTVAPAAGRGGKFDPNRVTIVQR
jgi:site-specific DNA recombinase